ncbi:Abi family protein [Palleronia sp.]|uniref:Abi family protein n=1 Tax=Palleronia sp. TaxID=1940284 RepID=UPI0035C78BEA
MAFVAGLDETFLRSQEEFAKHFRAKYENPPPIWIAVGTWDWGKLSHGINHLSDGNRDALCRAIDPRLTRRTLVSWMRCLNEVRNACAHHSRLWNKALINSPRLQPGKIAEFAHMAGENGKVSDDQKKRLYGALIPMNFLMRAFHPNTEWPQRLAELVAEADLPEEVSLGSAGFPPDWRDDPLWS